MGLALLGPVSVRFTWLLFSPAAFYFQCIDYIVLWDGINH
jgi:hypothetical protein